MTTPTHFAAGLATAALLGRVSGVTPDVVSLLAFISWARYSHTLLSKAATERVEESRDRQVLELVAINVTIR